MLELPLRNRVALFALVAPNVVQSHSARYIRYLPAGSQTDDQSRKPLYFHRKSPYLDTLPALQAKAAIPAQPGKPDVTQFGAFVGTLTHSRWVIYSVHAQDLLQGIGDLVRDEQSRFDPFHHNIFEVIRVINNQEYDGNMKWTYSDEPYNNQFVGHLTALLSIAHPFDDQPDFDAAPPNGGEGIRAVKLPWIKLFDHIICGTNDTPRFNIRLNSSVDPTKSHAAYSTAIVAAGEINDCYRYNNPAQGIGYPMGSLQGPHMAAELLKTAGLNAYSHRVAYGQSLEMVTRYFAFIAKYAGFTMVIMAEKSRN